jgi:hypothetical protein
LVNRPHINKNKAMRLNQEIVDKINENAKNVSSVLELSEVTGISRVTLTKYCNLLGIQIEVKLRKMKRTGGVAFKLLDILEGKHPEYPTSKLKRRLILEGYKEDRCEECGTPAEWNGRPLSLQVDHIDGNNRNHRLQNLRILCPNCHSQTHTFGAKNIVNKKSSIVRS